MKFFRRQAIPSKNAEDHVKYKYVEQSLGLNHDEELQVNASILGATEFAEYALVHPNVRKICFLQVYVQILWMVKTILVHIHILLYKYI